MVCPYCDNEMELGLIQSPHEIAWTRGDKKHTIAAAKFHEGSVVLSPLSIKTAIEGNAVKAYICRKCRKVIIDYAKEAQ